MLWQITSVIGPLNMKTALQCLTLAWVITLAGASACALAQGNGPLKPPYEVTLDIDHDGKPDRAVLVEDPASGSADLAIYLGAGAGNPDLSRRPDVTKKNIAVARILRFESTPKGSLILMSGCGGCSNDYATTLTIVYRRGTFWVGRATYDWDTRAAIGTCDIDFLGDNGTRSDGLAKAKRIKGHFAPVKLADWSDARRPKACN
jgi:hypothetical protein